MLNLNGRRSAPALPIALFLSLLLGSCKDGAVGPEGDGITLSAASHDFGAFEAAQHSTPFVLTVTNDGQTTTGQLSTRFNNLTGQFLLAPDQCTGEALAPGGSCQIEITMISGGGAGSAQATLTVFTPGGDSGSITFSGTAFVREIRLVPDAKDFGSLPIGTAGPAQDFVVANRGTVATGTLSAPLLSGPNAADFSLASDSCSGHQLPPQGSCTLSYLFKPQVAGAREAFLFISGTSTELAEADLTGSGL